MDKVVVRQCWGGGGDLAKRSRGQSKHGSVSVALVRPGKQGAEKEERQLRGTEQGMFSRVRTCEGMEGGGDMVKACTKFGARRASVRDTRLKEVMVRKRDN